MVDALAVGWRPVATVARETVGHIKRKCMVKAGGGPGQGRMASATFIVGFKMCRRTTSCSSAIMAVHAIRHVTSLSMIELDLRPTGRRVTGFARITGRQMRSGFASCLHPVVTFHAAIDNSLVVENADIPGHTGMA